MWNLMNPPASKPLLNRPYRFCVLGHWPAQFFPSLGWSLYVLLILMWPKFGLILHGRFFTYWPCTVWYIRFWYTWNFHIPWFVTKNTALLHNSSSPMALSSLVWSKPVGDAHHRWFMLWTVENRDNYHRRSVTQTLDDSLPSSYHPVVMIAISSLRVINRLWKSISPTVWLTSRRWQ